MMNDSAIEQLMPDYFDGNRTNASVAEFIDTNAFRLEDLSRPVLEELFCSVIEYRFDHSRSALLDSRNIETCLKSGLESTVTHCLEARFDDDLELVKDESAIFSYIKRIPAGLEKVIDPCFDVLLARHFEAYQSPQQNYRTKLPLKFHGRIDQYFRKCIFGATVPGYTKIEFLGQGGLGTVWKAQHDETGEVVAIKTPRNGSVDLGKWTLRARENLEIRHPNIVRILDVVDSPPYAVMEYVDWPTLAEFLASTRRSPESWPNEKEIVTAVAEIADAYIHGFHDFNLLHLDLKPSNIFVSRGANGLHLRLFDYEFTDTEENIRNSDDLAFPRTRSYASTSLRAKRSNPLNTSSLDESYQLGILLFNLLTGKMSPLPNCPQLDETVQERTLADNSLPFLKQAVSQRRNGGPSLYQIYEMAVGNSPNRLDVSDMKQKLDDWLGEKKKRRPWVMPQLVKLIENPIYTAFFSLMLFVVVSVVFEYVVGHIAYSKIERGVMIAIGVVGSAFLGLRRYYPNNILASCHFEKLFKCVIAVMLAAVFTCHIVPRVFTAFASVPPPLEAGVLRVVLLKFKDSADAKQLIVSKSVESVFKEAIEKINAQAHGFKIELVKENSSVDLDDVELAKEFAFKHRASIVVWGEYDDTGCFARFKDFEWEFSPPKRTPMQSYPQDFENLKRDLFDNPHDIRHGLVSNLYLVLALRIWGHDQFSLPLMENSIKELEKHNDSSTAARLRIMRLILATSYGNAQAPRFNRGYELISQNIDVDDRFGGLFDLCNFCLMHGRLDLAEKNIAAMEECEPMNPLLDFQKAWFAESKRDFQQAIAMYDKLIEGSSIAPNSRVARCLPWAFNNKANVVLMKGQDFNSLELSIELLEKGLDSRPKGTEKTFAKISRNLADKYLTRYQFTKVKSDLQRAVDLCREVLELSDDSHTQFLLIIALHNSSHSDSDHLGMKLATDSIEHKELVAPFYVLRGAIHQKGGRPQSASQDFKRAIELFSTNRDNWVAMSRFSANGDALNLLKMLAREPLSKSPEYSVLIGLLYHLNEDSDKALPFWNRARRLSNDSPEINQLIDGISKL
jgi:serine/threonine protein kinase